MKYIYKYFILMSSLLLFKEFNMSLINSETNVEADINTGSCPICIEEFVDGDDSNFTICAHMFHVACLDKWHQVGGVDCPLCRTNINFDRSEACERAWAVESTTPSGIFETLSSVIGATVSFEDLRRMEIRENDRVDNSVAINNPILDTQYLDNQDRNWWMEPELLAILERQEG